MMAEDLQYHTKLNAQWPEVTSAALSLLMTELFHLNKL